MNWLERIGAEIDKIEGPDEEAWMLTNPDSPQYLKNAERQLANAIAPSLKWRVGDTFTAGRLGALLGHKVAYVKPFVEGLRVSKIYKSTKLPAEVVEGLEKLEKEMLEYHPVV